MVTLVNRAKVATTSTGTGTITLGAAESGYQSFADAGVVNSDVVRYTIEDGDAWEIGTGGINAAVTTMSRTLIESSTGSKLNLSGEAVVYVTATGEDIQQPPSEGAFVDGDKTKLDGIEAGATTDQTKADIDALGIAASTANTLATTRNISLTGDVSGSTNFDGSGNVSITAVVADDSHNHVISNVDGLQTELDGKLSTSGKAADSNLLDGVQGSSYLRSDTSDTANSNISFASGAGLSGGLDSNLSGFFLPQNPVGKHLKSPYFFNDVAYARLRGATVSVDVDGTPMTTTSKIDAMLNAGSDFWNMSAAGVTTVTITITNLPRNLNYGTYMGLTFGNEAWRANSITLEYSTDNGSTWTTARSTTSNSEEYFLGNFNGGSTATNALRWTLEDFNRNSMRIVSLFAYNFSSRGMGGLYVTRDGGDIYGNVTVDGTVSSSGFQFPDGTTQTTATASTSSTSQTSIATYSATTYGSAKLIVTVDRGSDRQVSELLIVHNGTTAFATEYGVTATGSTLANFDVDISGGNIRLLATATSATTTGYTVTEILVGA